jgi:L-alanine-DL-glutamate epimerase-like enolase superfamily enzyme
MMQSLNRRFTQRAFMKSTDVRIREVAFDYEDFRYRTPIKFGGVALDRVSILNARIVVESRNGRISSGFGSMPMGNVWAYPSKAMTYTETLAAMKAVVVDLAKAYRNHGEFGHPIELTMDLEPAFFELASGVSRSSGLPNPVPKLATLVCGSPFDAALHDAYGKSLGLNCYSTYSREFVNRDLGHYLGDDFRGEFLDQYVSTKAKPTMPLYHLVGALDPLSVGDIVDPVSDGLPETLMDWIPADGLTHLKIKLNGDDLAWDVERVLGVERVAVAANEKRNNTFWFYSLDFNEKCGSVGYLIEFLNRIRERAPNAFERIQYIEQPTKRDLHLDRENAMHEASQIRPVVIDESLLDRESLMLAKEMGYTGAALKACKGQSQSLLMAAAAKKDNLFLCVQDLTCPGASLIHSAGLAAHIPGVAAIESNGRQYCPAANERWKAQFPGIFIPTNGVLDTSLLDGPGLGTSMA